MFKPLALFIGLRYTKVRQKNHFVSLISKISMMGIMLGVTVLIVVLSVMNGFNRELQNRILGMVPHATIRGYDPIENWRLLSQTLSKEEGVVAAAPFSQVQGMLTHEGAVHAVMLNGIEPEEEKKVSIVHQHLRMGSLDALRSGEFNIILGAALANKLGVALGDKVTLVIPEATVSLAGVIPRFKRFTVVGTFRVGAEIDSAFAYVHWQDAAKLLHFQSHQVEGIRLKFEDLFAAPDISREIAARLSDAYYSTDWTYTHGNLFQAIKMEKTMISLLLFLIVAVACFNIVSGLVMLVTEKKGDIAILRTLGATQKTIRRIFMIQGMYVGFVGASMGIILGVVIAKNISQVFLWLEKVLNQELMKAYFINYLPSELNWNDVFLVASVAFTLSFLAAVYPAAKAAKVDPAEALRYE